MGIFKKEKMNKPQNIYYISKISDYLSPIQVQQSNLQFILISLYHPRGYSKLID